jgi:hypothetical protein
MEVVMRVKCIKNYYDKQLKEDIKVGAEFDVDEDRATVLIGAGVCDSVATTPTTEKVVKKPRAKKEA